MPIRSATNFGATTTRRVRIGCGRSWARNVADAIRSQGCKRHIARETSLQAELDSSSDSLGSWLVAEDSTPSEHVIRDELAVDVAGIASGFNPPRPGAEALLLHYWQGCSLAEIAVRARSDTGCRGRLLKRRFAAPPRAARHP